MSAPDFWVDVDQSLVPGGSAYRIELGVGVRAAEIRSQVLDEELARNVGHETEFVLNRVHANFLALFDRLFKGDA